MANLAVVRRSAVVPKRDLLLFDRVYVPNLAAELERLSDHELADAQYLVDQGLLASPSVQIDGVVAGSVSLRSKEQRQNSSTASMPRSLRVGDFYFDVVASQRVDTSKRLTYAPGRSHLPIGAERFIAATLTRTLESWGHCTYVPGQRDAGKGVVRLFDPLPLYWPSLGAPGSTLYAPLNAGVAVRLQGLWREGSGAPPATNNAEWELFEAIIDAMPIPGELEPLEAILDFKRAAQEKKRLERLTRWLQRTLLEDRTSPMRLRLDLEDLIQEYESHMRAEKMTVRHERIRILLALPSGLIRAVIGRPSRDALDFLTLREHKVRLSQAEMRAPGRELAYIASARERFDHHR
ncbi:hypothetical protein [Blastococcus sp. VKM Ac-2987]|uniref:hypothetical protein n=1 Tax=Blastococcus sp. VKM Ac-2987 TaxID=3004141 RepID=UPI0022ABAE2B|nr:hypothetical protein [Blastococcus sp. VKM Ac-2987]MCZ2857825.1 hypothetical protein [Blastococcus sp. VKM Ac-2987]